MKSCHHYNLEKNINIFPQLKMIKLVIRDTCLANGKFVFVPTDMSVRLLQNKSFLHQMITE